jgi:hypothetical protein
LDFLRNFSIKNIFLPKRKFILEKKVIDCSLENDPVGRAIIAKL